MSVPNPKTAAELLALPTPVEERRTLRTKQEVDDWIKLNNLGPDHGLRIGDTVRVYSPEELAINPVDPDTVFAARDAYGELWVQRGYYRVRLSL